MISDAHVLLSAARASEFALMLDEDDYARAATFLSPRCAYDTGAATLVGPDAIIASYRASSEKARRLFDSIEYISEIAGATADTATILYIDRITHKGETHEYRCRQRIRWGADGLIAAIVHEDIPGERERLRAYCERVGVDLGGENLSGGLN
jgi:hypothetical protein